MIFSVDFKGHKNLLAQEIPSAVGMRGLAIPALQGEFDFATHRFQSLVDKGEFRPVSLLPRSAA